MSWKRDTLQVSLDILIVCLTNYQRAVREAKAKFFSKVIPVHANRPKELFNTISLVFNPRKHAFLDATQETCDESLNFFTLKIDQIKGVIVTS